MSQLIKFHGFESAVQTIATHAWERWTNNGLGMDDDMQAQTCKSAIDAANNAYLDDMSDDAWLDATVASLTGK